jgi:hypothetical protein
VRPATRSDRHNPRRRLSAGAARHVARRRPLSHVPLIKPILALDGQTVCRVGPLITVDGREMGIAHDKDHTGRPLPFWQGCRSHMPPGLPSISATNEVLRARRQAGVEPGATTGRRGGVGGCRSAFGRGRTAFSRSRLFAANRRVVVKARVVRHQDAPSARRRCRLTSPTSSATASPGTARRAACSAPPRTTPTPWPSRDAA